ncbi:MAG: hypothetical protein JST68_26245 [Bacteroidetes bacterium]|nr:hypothetical protein [Bacteroidota bacterium]
MGANNELLALSQHEYLLSSIFYREVIDEPYGVLEEAFDFSDVMHYRKLIKNLLVSAWSDKMYRKDKPGNLMFEFKMLESIINAAWLIEREGGGGLFKVGEEDLMDRRSYCGRMAYLDEWDYFPRALSRKECMNPCLVFKRFFKYRELGGWKKDLEEVLMYALLENGMKDEKMGVGVDLLGMFMWLTKLVEAAHLVVVRREQKRDEDEKE